jgi:hypothetical protein
MRYAYTNPKLPLPNLSISFTKKPLHLVQQLHFLQKSRCFFNLYDGMFLILLLNFSGGWQYLPNSGGLV